MQKPLIHEYICVLVFFLVLFYPGTFSGTEASSLIFVTANASISLPPLYIYFLIQYTPCFASKHTSTDLSHFLAISVDIYF